MSNGVLNKDKITATLSPIFRIYNIRSAVLFGSYAKATAGPDSDVDILVDSGLKGMKFVGFIEEVRKALKKDVDILDTTHIDSDSKVSREIKKNGTLIYER